MDLAQAAFLWSLLTTHPLCRAPGQPSMQGRWLGFLWQGYKQPGTISCMVGGMSLPMEVSSAMEQLLQWGAWSSNSCSRQGTGWEQGCDMESREHSPERHNGQGRREGESPGMETCIGWALRTDEGNKKLTNLISLEWQLWCPTAKFCWGSAWCKLSSANCVWN